MKTPRTASLKRAFTLIELLVAMAITAIIVMVLVSITSIAVDTWNRSRAELRASRQAKVMVDTMARDLESLVVRRGNAFEWLTAANTTASLGDAKLISTNSSDLIFFSAVTDRYDGKYINDASLVGDISCVGYRLYYNDPINNANTGSTFKTFVLKRYLVSPSNKDASARAPHTSDDTFTDLLGKTDLKAAFTGYFGKLENNSADFVCENVFQFTVTFNVEAYSGSSKKYVIENVPVGQSSSKIANSFRVMGNKIDIPSYAPSACTAAELAAGRVASVEISVTVLSGAGMDQLRSPRPLTTTQQAEFLARNTYNYTKRVLVPGM